MTIGVGMFPSIFLLLILGSFHPGSHLPPYMIILCFLATTIPAFIFALKWAKKEIKKMHWELNDAELSCGISNPQKFPLVSIEKIIVGLPSTNEPVMKTLQRAKPGTVLGTSVDVVSTVQPAFKLVRNLAILDAVKENSLLLCFNDGSWLAPKLATLSNGRALMDALRERCKNRVIESYNFSPDERRRVQSRSANELIPPPKT
jgi:hypothetical protein